MAVEASKFGKRYKYTSEGEIKRMAYAFVPESNVLRTLLSVPQLDDKPKTKTYSYSNIKPTATADDMFNLATLLNACQANQMASARRAQTNLVEESV